jgi:hypothetical protein
MTRSGVLKQNHSGQVDLKFKDVRPNLSYRNNSGYIGTKIEDLWPNLQHLKQNKPDHLYIQN